MVKAVANKFSLKVAAQKSLKNTVVQIIVAGLALLISNPQIIWAIIGNWKEMTVGTVILLILNALYNWLKNFTKIPLIASK